MSIIDHARSELTRAGASEEYKALLVKAMEEFFEEYDSGGAVAVMLPRFTGDLQRLIAGKPLSPLTGAEDEWNDVSNGGPPSWQNKRCSSVFKDADGRCYDIDTPGRPTITFPYSPEKAEVRMPVFEVDTTPQSNGSAHVRDDGEVSRD